MGCPYTVTCSYSLDYVYYPGIIFNVFPFHSQKSSGKILNHIFILFIKDHLLQWEIYEGNTALEEWEMLGSWRVFKPGLCFGWKG